MSVVELNAIAGVRQYLGYATLEFQQFFLGHLMVLLNVQPNPARVGVWSRFGRFLLRMKATVSMPRGASFGWRSRLGLRAEPPRWRCRRLAAPSDWVEAR
jgi:hypothetical protein